MWRVIFDGFFTLIMLIMLCINCFKGNTNASIMYGVLTLFWQNLTLYDMREGY